MKDTNKDKVVFSDVVVLIELENALPSFDISNRDKVEVVKQAYFRSARQVLEKEYPGADIDLEIAFPHTWEDTGSFAHVRKQITVNGDVYGSDSDVWADLSNAIYTNMFQSDILKDVCREHGIRYLALEPEGETE